ncbi:MAG: sugar phosphate isomerase/epimerase, partial [Clostridia bacterium]|nr:sugar phosphate isomerase/epimerase [Clostridia bacterium]
MKILPVGLQLFTVREEMAKDLPGALKAVKEAGYDYVETAGFFGLSGEEFKKQLDIAGLKAISAHVPLNDML